jgi:hypothetical protein
VATIDDAGLATTIGTGSTAITAAENAVTGSATLTVTPAVLVAITIDPLDPAIPLGTTQQFTATGL